MSTRAARVAAAIVLALSVGTLAACGSGITLPTGSPTVALPTANPTAELPTPTIDATRTPLPRPTRTPTAEPSPTPEPTAEPTPEPTAEPTPEPTAEPAPSVSAAPTAEPSAVPTAGAVGHGDPDAHTDLDADADPDRDAHRDSLGRGGRGRRPVGGRVAAVADRPPPRGSGHHGVRALPSSCECGGCVGRAAWSGRHRSGVTRRMRHPLARQSAS